MTTMPEVTAVVRPHAEQAFADELAALRQADDRPRPPKWRMSPYAVATYLLGGTLADGTVITPKYIGPRRLIEIAIAIAGHRPGAAPARRARHGQDLGERAPGRGHQRRLHPASCKGRRARRRKPSATGGTTPVCSPRDRADGAGRVARSCGPCSSAASPGSRSSPGSPPTSRTP